MVVENGKIGRLFISMMVVVIINAIITTTKTELEIPVVYLSGISGALDNQQEFEEALVEIERTPGLTVAQEFELLDERMDYHREEKVKAAADLATEAVVVGYNTAVKNQERLAKEIVSIESLNNLEKKFVNGVVYYKSNNPQIGWFTMEDVMLTSGVSYIEMEQYENSPYAKKAFQLTGSVIVNRMLAPVYYPDTVKGVIYQKNPQQYATRTLEKLSTVKPPHEVVEYIVELFVNGPIGPSNLVFQDNQIHGEIYEQIGNIYFCTTTIF